MAVRGDSCGVGVVLTEGRRCGARAGNNYEGTAVGPWDRTGRGIVQGEVGQCNMGPGDEQRGKKNQSDTQDSICMECILPHREGADVRMHRSRLPASADVGSMSGEHL